MISPVCSGIAPLPHPPIHWFGVLLTVWEGNDNLCMSSRSHPHKYATSILGYGWYYWGNPHIWRAGNISSTDTSQIFGFLCEHGWETSLARAECAHGQNVMCTCTTSNACLTRWLRKKVENVHMIKIRKKMTSGKSCQEKSRGVIVPYLESSAPGSLNYLGSMSRDRAPHEIVDKIWENW